VQALIDFTTNYIQHHQAWAGPIIFVLTFCESMLIVGILVPATALLLFAGGLIGNDTLPLLPILLWGYAGAIIGDAISYWIGKKLGRGVLRWGPLKPHRKSVARARLFFYRFGFVAVLAGRFLGPLRSTVPTVSGVMGMTELKFQFANVISALFWVPGLLAPGYLATTAIKAVGASTLSNTTVLYSTVGFCILLSIGLLIVLSHRNQHSLRNKSLRAR
jgi:membrane protein DedA with SNARE-associated domain